MENKYLNKSDFPQDTIWRAITREGYEQFYEVCQYGAIYIKKINKVTYGTFDKITGYMRININNGKRRVTTPVHILVATAFPDLVKKHNVTDNVINHIDENKTNNNWYNLEYVTQKQNTLHSIHKNCKKVKCIETGKIFNSIKDAAEHNNISDSQMRYICKNNKVCNGFHFYIMDNKDMEVNNMYKLIMVNGIEYDYFIGDVKYSDTELYNDIMCKPFLNIIDKNGNTILVNTKYIMAIKKY